MNTRRAKPQKREFKTVERAIHRDRLRPARVFRVRPEPALPWFHVEVRISKSRRAMRGEMSYCDGQEFAMTVERECMGLVRTWWSPRTRRAGITRKHGLVARIYLNTPDLRSKPSEIVSHECTHAGMAWARFRRANLHNMPGEEVLAYAVGRLVQQVNRVCFAHGVWK